MKIPYLILHTKEKDVTKLFDKLTGLCDLAEVSASYNGEGYWKVFCFVSEYQIDYILDMTKELLLKAETATCICERREFVGKRQIFRSRNKLNKPKS